MKITPEFIQGIVTLVVGGGFATLITQVVRGWNSLRGGARASTRAVIRDLADDRKEAESRYDHQVRLTDFWRGVAANYGYQLRSNGITPDPESPIPPGQMVKEDARARRTVKEMEDTLTSMDLTDLDDDDPPSSRRRR